MTNPTRQQPYTTVYALYAGVLETRGYVVGSANASSGMHVRTMDGSWSHRGWTNIRCFDLAFHPADTDIVYMAAGNGVLRSTDAGLTWRVTTGWQVTEVLSIVVDADKPTTVFAGTAYGPWSSFDAGTSWQQRTNGLEDRFTQVVAIDGAQSAYLLAGTEVGLHRSADAGTRWTYVGPPATPIRAVAQDPFAPAHWVAGTEGNGILVSWDDGQTWHRDPAVPPGDTVYAISFSPIEAGLIAVGGYRNGLRMGRFSSSDAATRWEAMRSTSSDRSIHALAFDPKNPDHLWAGTTEEGVFLVDTETGRWEATGLPEAEVRHLSFLPQAGTPT